MKGVGSALGARPPQHWFAGLTPLPPVRSLTPHAVSSAIGFNGNATRLLPLRFHGACADGKELARVSGLLFCLSGV
jgi:hypothetical protein